MRSLVRKMTPRGTNLLHGVNDAGELFITQRFKGASSKKGDRQISLLIYIYVYIYITLYTVYDFIKALAFRLYNFY